MTQIDWLDIPGVDIRVLLEGTSKVGDVDGRSSSSTGLEP